MPDPNETVDSGTQQGSDESTPVEQGMSDSSLVTSAMELPEEYRPYDAPWDQIPEDVRPTLLGWIKKFHGNMSKRDREATELRRQIPDLQQKANLFDTIARHPTFLDWYNRAFNQGSQPSSSTGEPAKPLHEALGGAIDRDGLEALLGHIKGMLQSELAPLKDELQFTQRMYSTDRSQQELDALRSKVQKNGWPEITDDVLDAMGRVVSSGRSTKVEDAYRLAVWEDALNKASTTAVSRERSRLGDQAAVTPPPYAGPSRAPTSQNFKGNDGILRALKASRDELSRQGIRPETFRG